ncbi:glutamate dehydrogenase, partial [Methanosarcinales archaeon]
KYLWREFSVRFPLRYDDGHTELISGYRVQHNTLRGPAKGGVQCDPSEMSQKESERLTRRYIWEISPIIGPDKDIPAPDINTNPQIMAWIVDTYSVFKGYTCPSVVTGKP